MSNSWESNGRIRRISKISVLVAVMRIQLKVKHGISFKAHSYNCKRLPKQKKFYFNWMWNSAFKIEDIEILRYLFEFKHLFNWEIWYSLSKSAFVYPTFLKLSSTSASTNTYYKLIRIIIRKRGSITSLLYILYSNFKRKTSLYDRNLTQSLINHI